MANYSVEKRIIWYDCKLSHHLTIYVSVNLSFMFDPTFYGYQIDFSYFFIILQEINLTCKIKRSIVVEKQSEIYM